jgi:hypothetical protein
VSRLAGAVFAVLAVATFAAFFVAQRLKHQPAVVQEFMRYPFFSPNGDGRLDAEHISFKIKKTDDVTVDVVNAAGDPVRRLVSDEHLNAFRRLPTLRWNGRTDSGAHAPDGIYRVRVILRSQDRSVIVPESFRLDTMPPHPEVIGVGVKGKRLPGPEAVDFGAASTQIDYSAPGTHRVITIYRTDVAPAVVVERIAIRNRAPAVGRAMWNGLDATGQPVAPGVYLAGIQARDEAGNRGAVPPLDAKGLPIVRYGHHLTGHGGITVSDLVVQPPLTPTAAGAPVTFFVGSRHRAYSWSVRRVGGPAKPLSAGQQPVTATSAMLTITAPQTASSGVYLLKVHSHVTTLRVPFAVNGTASVGGTPAAPRGVLVVLPAMTWQGRNPVDTDGDGEPDTLDAGVGVDLARPFSGDGLPIGFAGGEADAVDYLDNHHHVYDITTDLALAEGHGPNLADYSGVLLAGDERWITTGLAGELTAFVHHGGALASLGTDSLMRRVRISAHGRLYKPTARAKTDIFGARILPQVNRPVTLTNLQPNNSLFIGTVGQFIGYFRYEPTASLGTAMSLDADAVDGAGQPVIVAAHYGRGLVIRTGLPDFAASLVPSHQTAQLFERIWTLLSR